MNATESTAATSARPVIQTTRRLTSVSMDRPRTERVSPSLLRIVDRGATAGFVEKAGPVFVALVGDRYDRAVEVSQSLSLDAAARSVIDAIG
jgi:hypothetical protein